MKELAEIHDLGGRAGSYAMLSYSLDTADPVRGALLQKARELGAAIETQLLFFDLEWNKAPDERADELLAAPELAFAAHHLRTLRRYRPHQLSEPEERVLTETNVTGGSAFQRLFTEQTSALQVPLPDRDEPASLEEGLSRLQDPDREKRAEAAAAVTESLRPGLHTRAFVFNTLLQDKATKDRLRGYPHWLASRNLANEASDESVQALIEAVQGRYDLARRWYALKARLLGPRQARLLRPHGPGVRQRRPHPLRATPRRSCSTATAPSRRSSARWPRSSSRAATSTARRALASAAAPSARTPCPRRTRT